jgi:hypothetical protein
LNEKVEEDLTYLIVTMKNQRKGLKPRFFERGGKSYPESFVASEAINWMVRTLYLADPKMAVELGKRLANQQVIICTAAHTVRERKRKRKRKRKKEK